VSKQRQRGHIPRRSPILLPEGTHVFKSYFNNHRLGYYLFFCMEGSYGNYRTEDFLLLSPALGGMHPNDYGWSNKIAALELLW